MILHYYSNNLTETTCTSYRTSFTAGKRPFLERYGFTNQSLFSLKQIQSDLQQNTTTRRCLSWPLLVTRRHLLDIRIYLEQQWYTLNYKQCKLLYASPHPEISIHPIHPLIANLFYISVAVFARDPKSELMNS